MAVALTILSILKAHIGVSKHGVNISGSAGDLTSGCQQLLLCGSQSMRFEAAGIGQATAITLQFRTLSIQLLHSFVRNGHQLRSFKATRSTETNQHATQLAGHSLIEGITSILVRLSHSIVCQSADFYICHLRQVQEIIQSLAALAEFACIRNQCCLVSSQSSQFGFPSFVADEQVFSCPGIFYRDLGTLTDLVNIGHRKNLL